MIVRKIPLSPAKRNKKEKFGSYVKLFRFFIDMLFCLYDLGKTLMDISFNRFQYT